MGRAKKLQVFVSSTYTDLKEDRQAAVEGILTAGHIPAGMELFTAGDQTQMEVIRQWITESDVFLLILGGRYGSIEPTSQKSYVQLEYEFAIECGKALFAVVISDDYLEKRVRKNGSSVKETERSNDLKNFRSKVLSRLVRFWSDPRDIKLAVIETLSQFSRRLELIGWVPGDEASKTTVFVDEIARLTKENSLLRDRLEKPEGSAAIYKGLTYEEMFKLLVSEPMHEIKDSDIRNKLMQTAIAFDNFGNESLLHAVWMLGERLSQGLNVHRGEDLYKVCDRLTHFGLVDLKSTGGGDYKGLFSDDGKMFFLRMKVKCTTEASKRCIEKPSD